MSFDELIPLGRRRLQWAGAARLLLAVAALVVDFTAADGANLPRRLFVLAYTAYAVGAVISRRLERYTHAAPSLIVDGAFLLICASFRGVPSALLSAGVFTFLLSWALLFHARAHLLAITIVCLPLMVVLHPEYAEALVPGLLAGSAISLIASRQKERLMTSESSDRVSNAVEAERQRLAADFHDGPLQGFASFQMRLEVIRKLLELEPQAAMKELLQLQALAQAQSQEIRAFIHSLSGIVPTGVAFHSALIDLVDAFRRESGIAATLDGLEPIGPVDPALAGEALKIVKEALHNAYKHSGASQIAVRVEKSVSTLDIGVRDNGDGFPFTGELALEQLEAMHLGPESIKRRVRALGGTLTVESRPGSGTELLISIPA